MIDLYQNKKVPTIDDYIAMWTKFGISNEIGKKVQEKTEQFLDSGLNQVIWNCYEKILQAFDMETQKRNRY